MTKRTFSTARKKPEPKPTPRIKGRGGKASRATASRRQQPRTTAPRAAAAPPPGNDSTKLLIIGGVVAALILVVAVVALGSRNANNGQTARPGQPAAQQQLSTHERMMNQRYGGEMDGKTVREWMEENGETEFAKERQAARKNR